jgi:hypothetical protein
MIARDRTAHGAPGTASGSLTDLAGVESRQHLVFPLL